MLECRWRKSSKIEKNVRSLSSRAEYDDRLYYRRYRIKYAKLEDKEKTQIQKKKQPNSGKSKVDKTKETPSKKRKKKSKF